MFQNKYLSFKYSLYSIGFSLVVSLFGCGGGGGSAGINPSIGPATSVPLFTTAPVTLTLGVGAAQDFAIGGGVAPYSAVSNNASVGTSGVNSGRVTVGGISPGNAEITVRDSLGASVKINLTVGSGIARALFTNSASDIVVAPGAVNAQTYTVGGGTAPYSASSSNASAASVSLVGDSLKITGVTTGAANIVILDNLGARLTIAVTVSAANNLALFTTAPAAVTVAVGASPVFGIGGGTAPYTVSTSNASVASVSLVSSNLTIAGVAPGSANIVVRDSVGAVVTVVVTVPSPPTVALFTTAPSTVTIAVGASPSYTVSGGTGPYTAISNNAGVSTTALAGSNLTINGVGAGSAIISVRDNAGTVVNINVTIATAPLAVTPNNATGIIDDRLVATITGGAPPFRASVGNTNVAVASITNGNQLNITLRQVGSTIVTVLDVNNLSIPYTLTVNAATPGIRLSPNPLAVSELDTQPIFLTVYGAASGALNVFSSDTSKLVATISDQTVTLTTGTSGDRCVPSDLGVTITVVDSTRASGSAVVTIRDSVSPCP